MPSVSSRAIPVNSYMLLTSKQSFSTLAGTLSFYPVEMILRGGQRSVPTASGACSGLAMQRISLKGTQWQGDWDAV